MPSAVKHPPYPRITLFFPVLTALAFVGCGLAEYEKKMGEVETRAQRFDEENRYLADPLTLPSDGPPMEVFLRPPKGVAQNFSTQQGDVPYHYPATGAFTDVYLILGGADDDKEKLEKQIETRFGAANPTWQAVEAKPPGRPTVVFDAVEFIDPQAAASAPADYIAYVHRAPGHAPVSVVFRVLQSNLTPANRPGIDAAVNKSLESYREAADAQKARTEYGKWRTH